VLLNAFPTHCPRSNHQPRNHRGSFHGLLFATFELVSYSSKVLRGPLSVQAKREPHHLVKEAIIRTRQAAELVEAGVDPLRWTVQDFCE
jgi:hypothetical protein